MSGTFSADHGGYTSVSSVKLSGLKKGTLYVDARTWDWADNASKWSSVKAKITLS